MKEINEETYMQLLNFDDTRRREWMNQRKPFSVLFELTAKCNMNCIHCYLQNFHNAGEMTYDQITEILDILYDKGILFLTFTGGEILTRKDFLGIYLYAKRKGFLVELFTNGYLFNDEIIEVLKEYPPLLVDVSLYGASEKTYRYLTGVTGAYNKVIENCTKLKRNGIRISLKSPIIDATLPELDDMRQLSKFLDIPFVFTFEICNTIDRDDSPKSHQVPLKEILKLEFENYYEQIKEGRRKKVDKKIIEKLKGNKMVYSCNVAINSFVIDYKGNMCPCMKLRHKGVKLTKEKFDKIWMDFGKYSNQVSSDNYQCRGCDALYYCDVCPAEMDFLYNDPEYRPELICKSALIRKAFYEKEITVEQALKKASQ